MYYKTFEIKDWFDIHETNYLHYSIAAILKFKILNYSWDVLA